jgi:hypothetical protein
VVWQEFQIPVTGGNMDPGKGRLDFPLDAINTELGRRLERRINDEIERAREIMVTFLGCKAAASGMLDEPHVSIHKPATVPPRRMTDHDSVRRRCLGRHQGRRRDRSCRGGRRWLNRSSAPLLVDATYWSRASMARRGGMSTWLSKSKVRADGQPLLRALAVT